MQTKRRRCRERKKQDVYDSKLALQERAAVGQTLKRLVLSLLPPGNARIIFKVPPSAQILLVRIACKRGTLFTNHILN